MHQDWSVAEEQVGVKTTLIASEQSPHKVEAHPFGPLDSEARAELQRGVNSSAAWFIGDVARHRGVTEQTVRAKFGGGRMLHAEQAVAVGLADGVATLPDVLMRLQHGLTIKSRTTRATSIGGGDVDVLRRRLRLKQYNW